MAKNKKKKKQGLFFKFVKSLLNLFYGRRKFIGLENLNEEPQIIVGNHSQMHGPITAEIRFPKKRITWCAGGVMHFKGAPTYIFQDFFGYKPKWTHWFYKIVAFLITPLCVYIFKNADTIPVYRDGRGVITFKRSMEALKQNINVIIFPEEHKKYNEIVYEFQNKFVDLARLYHKNTGKEISFVPMYIAPKLKTVCFGKPLKFNQDLAIEEQRTMICEYLKEEITKMAKDLPVHTVIPYANIPKKKYPKSK